MINHPPWALVLIGMMIGAAIFVAIFMAGAAFMTLFE
jgi:cytochrome c oxidase subunit IV